MQSTKRKILIVDNEPLQLNLLHDALNYAGYEVLAATDGQTALDIAALVLPDLILMDVDMPDPNGLETCCRLKSDPALRDIPVVFQTGRVGAAAIAAGFAAGGADYITKPFRLYGLLAAMRAQLGETPPAPQRPRLKIERLIP